MMFDRAVLRDRPQLAGADFLHVTAAEEIVERLALVRRTFGSILVGGPSTPALAKVWGDAGLSALKVGPSVADRPDVVADLAMPFARAFDLAISINELHLADDPISALGEVRATLQPDGLFLGAVAASGTLDELRESLIAAEAELTGGATLRVAPFGDVRRWGDGLAKAGFALPVSDELRVTARYDGIDGLVADLEAMGLRRILASRSPAPRRLFATADAIYRERYADPDGRVRATFAFAFLSGWAPDPGQPKAAPRGSANASLEDALKAFGGSEAAAVRGQAQAASLGRARSSTQ